MPLAVIHVYKPCLPLPLTSKESFILFSLLRPARGVDHLWPPITLGSQLIVWSTWRWSFRTGTSREGTRQRAAQSGAVLRYHWRRHFRERRVQWQLCTTQRLPHRLNLSSKQTESLIVCIHVPFEVWHGSGGSIGKGVVQLSWLKYYSPALARWMFWNSWNVLINSRKLVFVCIHFSINTVRNSQCHN